MISGLQGIYDQPEIFHLVANSKTNVRCWSIIALDDKQNLRWRGWFIEKAAADCFMAAIREGYIPDYFRQVPIPCWLPGLGEEILEYQLQTTEFLTASPGVQQNWPVPVDWNDGNNTVETLAGGSSAEAGTQGGGGFGVSGRGGRGGGGGAYSAQSNITLSDPTAPYTIGNLGGDSWFNGTSLVSASVSAEGGAIPTGGNALNGIGTTKFSGGNGGARGVGNADTGGGGGGGGGSAGPGGDGRNGGDGVNGGSNGTTPSGGGAGGGGGANGSSSTAGSSGTNTSGGAGGNGPNGTGGGAVNGGGGLDGGGGGGFPAVQNVRGTGGAGGTNIAWSSNGVGGGGGGGGGTSGNNVQGSNGGAGGIFGGGGGGPGGGAAFGGGLGGIRGLGQQGIIVITYSPPAGGNRGYVFG